MAEGVTDSSEVAWLASFGDGDELLVNVNEARERFECRRTCCVASTSVVHKRKNRRLCASENGKVRGAPADSLKSMRKAR